MRMPILHFSCWNTHLKEDNEKLDDLITQIPAANKVYMMIPIIGESSTRRFESSGERFVCIAHLFNFFWWKCIIYISNWCEPHEFLGTFFSWGGGSNSFLNRGHKFWLVSVNAFFNGWKNLTEYTSVESTKYPIARFLGYLSPVAPGTSL